MKAVSGRFVPRIVIVAPVICVVFRTSVLIVVVRDVLQTPTAPMVMFVARKGILTRPANAARTVSENRVMRTRTAVELTRSVTPRISV